MTHGRTNRLFDADAAWRWCETILPAVSRTFAICIRFLPDDLRRTVLLSYLLCRIADTVEDASELDPAAKRQLLARFTQALGDGAVDLDPLVAAVANRHDPDARLVRSADDVVHLLHTEEPVVRELVATWVGEMCRGMAEFAGRAAEPTAHGVLLLGLSTEADLDRYCYYVAGTVGHLLTALFAAKRPRLAGRTAADLEELAEDFGAGLQLVNILVDVARDYHRGVSYVPASLCREVGLSPEDLLKPAQQSSAREVLLVMSRRARQRLDAARRYCLLLPRTEYQLRLFCTVPYFLALRTLRALEFDTSYPAAEQRVKVGRRTVYRTVAAARVCAASNHLLRAYSHRLAGAF